MKAQIKPTNKILKVNGTSVRIWEGLTDDNVRIKCYITRIAIDKDNPKAKDLEKEINNCANEESPDSDFVFLKLIL